ncbi:hypothetical protein [Polaromonas sp. LjRoot131]|uniref:hypothetical protein n=1 Tax=Polaromonas sp. LjRoot131 TaxID=3342262 RepID=UPI003ED14B42
MKFEILRSRISSVNIALALLIFAHAASSIAKPNEKAAASPAAEASAKPVCIFSEAAQQKARRLVERTDAFKTVQRQARQAKPVGRVVYLDRLGIDQPELWKGKCHQPVTVYVDRLNRFERRFTMLVDLGTGKLFLEDANGEYQALKKSAPKRATPAIRPTNS